MRRWSSWACVVVLGCGGSQRDADPSWKFTGTRCGFALGNLDAQEPWSIDLDAYAQTVPTKLDLHGTLFELKLASSYPDVRCGPVAGAATAEAIRAKHAGRKFARDFEVLVDKQTPQSSFHYVVRYSGQLHGHALIPGKTSAGVSCEYVFPEDHAWKWVTRQVESIRPEPAETPCDATSPDDRAQAVSTRPSARRASMTAELLRK